MPVFDRSGPATLGEAQRRSLTLTNLLALGLMVVHDLDHVRVAMDRGYALPLITLTAFTLAYLPNLMALALVRRRSRRAPMATALAGVVVFLGFIGFHIVGAACISNVLDLRPLLGVWVSSYVLLQVDAWSWTMLAVNMAGAAWTVRQASKVKTAVRLLHRHADQLV